MKTTTRNVLAAAALFATGGFAGPMIVDAQAAPTPAQGNLATAGPTSVFVPIAAYRTLDTRELAKLNVDGIEFSPDSPSIQFFADLDRANPSGVAIPAEAIAISYNITAVQTEGRGFLSINPANFNGASTGATSVVNWTSDDQQVANSGNVLLGTATDGEGNGSDYVQVDIGGESGAKAHVLVDVTGYYLPLAP